MAQRVKSIFITFMLALAAGLLSGCRFVMLNPKGIIAADEMRIMIISVLLMLIVVIPVIILAIVFSWRYRESNEQACYDPEWSHSTILEIIWWSIPCVIIGILGVITWDSSHRLDPYKAITVNHVKPITIQAIALDWKWLFIYPEQHIATINFIQFPVNTPIKFLISAEGAMNSLQIPQLGGQIYAMAGMRSKLYLIANHPGDYKGMSSNFSGTGFAGMNFIARASTQEEFVQWVNTVKLSQSKLSLENYQQLVKPSIDNAVAYYSSANDEIFNLVVMKSMIPMSMVASASNDICNRKLIASINN